MLKELRKVKIGLALVLLGLAFGIGMGISFGVNEDTYKSYISTEIQAHPEVHDEKARIRSGATHNGLIFMPRV